MTGPVLGSMDARDVATGLECTRTGLLYTTTSQRSAEYQGGVHKDAPWRARTTIVLLPKRASPVFKAVWRMKRSDGVPISHAQTPPYPTAVYPIETTMVLR